MLSIALQQEQQQRIENDLEPLDALSFEIKHSQDYQKAQSSYIEYEIDSVEEEFGELFRVWDRRTLVGTLYETSQGWKATPFYLCRQYINAELDFSQDVEDSGSAIAYIQSMYEGRRESLTSESTVKHKIEELITA